MKKTKKKNKKEQKKIKNEEYISLEQLLKYQSEMINSLNQTNKILAQIIKENIEKIKQHDKEIKEIRENIDTNIFLDNYFNK